MTEMTPEFPPSSYGVRIKAVEHVLRTEPGQILAEHIDEWVRLGVSPELMMRGVETAHGVGLSQVAERTLGAWATEETRRHYDQQLYGQGELEWQQQ
jgi:hypothetical protein